MLLIVVILMIFWSLVIVASGTLLFVWAREVWSRFSFEDQEEDVEGPSPVGFHARWTDEMGWTEFVDEEDE